MSGGGSSPRLKVSREKAAARLQEQIARGGSLLPSPGAPLQSADVDRASASVDRWAEYNSALLTTMFDGGTLAAEYRDLTRETAGAQDDHFQRLLKLRRSLDEQVAKLSSVVQALPLFEGAPAPRPGPATGGITIFGGSNQLNMGTILGNMEMKLGTLSGPSAEDFKTAVRGVVEAVRAGGGLTEAQQGEVIEQFDYLAEMAARPPEERKSSVLRSVVEGVKTTLSLAPAARDAWEAWGPTIRGFLGIG